MTAASLTETVTSLAAHRGWVTTPLKFVFRRSKRLGDGSEQLLSIYRDHGVIPKDSRSDNFNKASDDLSKYQKVDTGDLVVNKMKAWQGSVAISDHAGTISPAYFVYRPTLAADMNTRYLHYLLRSGLYFQHYGSISTGVRPNQWDLDPAAFERTLLLQPPTAEQDAIADYLDHETAEIENLVSDQRKFQVLLEELRSSEISRAFPTEDPVRLKWVLDMAITGPFGTALSASEYITGGVPVINPTHIHRGQIASDLDVSISEEKAAALSRFRMNVGDIILGRKGEVDKAALVDHRFAGSICGSDSMLLRPSAQLHSEYFWWFLQSPQAQSQLQLWSVGSTVQGLNQNTINRIHIPCPPVDMQEQISDEINGRATGIDDLLRETTRVMQLARERRAALITAAVTGQIDVTARHKPAAEQLEDDIAQGLHREN